MLNIEHGHAQTFRSTFQSPRYMPVNCAGGGVYFDLKRPRAVLVRVPCDGEGKAKIFNLLLAGPKVLNLCKLAETKVGYGSGGEKVYEDDKRLHFPNNKS